MTNKQYLDAIKKLGLSVVGAAPALGVGRRQAQRFAAGQEIPKPVEKLLNLMVKHGIKPEEV